MCNADWEQNGMSNVRTSYQRRDVISLVPSVSLLMSLVLGGALSHQFHVVRSPCVDEKPKLAVHGVYNSPPPPPLIGYFMMDMCLSLVERSVKTRLLHVLVEFYNPAWFMCHSKAAGIQIHKNLFWMCLSVAFCEINGQYYQARYLVSLFHSFSSTCEVCLSNIAHINTIA